MTSMQERPSHGLVRRVLALIERAASPQNKELFEAAQVLRGCEDDIARFLNAKELESESARSLEKALILVEAWLDNANALRAKSDVFMSTDRIKATELLTRATVLSECSRELLEVLGSVPASPDSTPRRELD